MTRTAVYRHYAADGSLLYVGLSANPTRRLSEHNSRSGRREEVARIDLEWFDSKEAAIAAEAQAISEMKPRDNVMGIKTKAQSITHLNHPVAKVLAQWPTRTDILTDAQASHPDLDLFAVHRWFQRGSVPSRYWRALLIGAERRGLPVTVDALMTAHAERAA